MPLEIVKKLADSERPKCDIEFIDIQNDRLFTSSEGGNVKVKYFSFETSWLHIRIQ